MADIREHAGRDGRTATPDEARKTMSDEELLDHAARTLAHTRRIIDSEDATAWAILSAVKRHGVAMWQMGQHQVEWDWFCTLSHKAAWGDVFYKAEHQATPIQAIREAAREWSKTR
jgi:hypothetical protein